MLVNYFLFSFGIIHMRNMLKHYKNLKLLIIKNFVRIIEKHSSLSKYMLKFIQYLLFLKYYHIA